MQKAVKKGIAASIAIFSLTALAVFPSAQAIHSPDHYNLFGDASYITPDSNGTGRAVRLVSEAGGNGGINYPVESGTTFGDLTTLSTDFRLPEGDTCIGGSPRFQIKVQTPSGGTQNIFAYFGTDSGGAPCLPNVWQNTGDFLEVNRLLDTSQLPGGTFYDPYASALSKYASYPVMSIQVVTDSSWHPATGGRHVVDIDDTLINTTLFTYDVVTTKDECKNGGWMTMTDDEGNSFRNQGDCVSFVASKGKNKGSN